MSWMRNSKRPINRIDANTPPLRARGSHGALAGEVEKAKPKRFQMEGPSHKPGSRQVTMSRGVVVPEDGATAQKWAWSVGLRTDYGDRINDKARLL
jgi:hypothetical protein